MRKPQRLPQPSAELPPPTGDGPRHSLRAPRPPRRLETLLVAWSILATVAAGLFGTLCYHDVHPLRWLAGGGAPEVVAAPAPDGAAAPAAFATPSPDEADELAAIRRSIEAAETDVDGARALLAHFRARAHDASLAELARQWEGLLPSDGESVERHVSWTRFRIDRAGYRSSNFAALEFGRPDVYLRVYRTRDGDDERVFDTSRHPVESWAHDWPNVDDRPGFELSWRAGDSIRVELWDRDNLADNRLAVWEIEGDLAAFGLAGAHSSPEGHAIELMLGSAPLDRE